MDSIDLIAVIALVVLAFSQFITMISNVSGNLIHRQQVQDVRAMREAQAESIAEEEEFRMSVGKDFTAMQHELSEIRKVVDVWALALPFDWQAEGEKLLEEMRETWRKLAEGNEND